MPVSEIDDIFAGKTSKLSSTHKNSVFATAKPSTSVSVNKVKKRKQGNDDAAHTPPGEGREAKAGEEVQLKRKKKKPNHSDERKDASEEKKSPGVTVTVHDPSVNTVARSFVAATSAKQKLRSANGSGSSKSIQNHKPKGQKDDLDNFRDSRGNGPRKRTEEGFLVFKEDELGIRPESGGTSLCPFDCDCCF